MNINSEEMEVDDSEEEMISDFHVDDFLSPEEVSFILEGIEGDPTQQPSPMITDMCVNSHMTECIQQAGETCPMDLDSSPSDNLHLMTEELTFPHVSNSSCVLVNQYGRGAGEEGEEEEEEEGQVPMKEEEQLQMPSMPLDVFNFPNSFFHLQLRKTKSFKHKQDEIINEQSYTATLREEVMTDEHANLGDIQPQLYLLFHSLLEEINNYYSPNDLVRVFITHEELVNTNIVVGPDYLGNFSAQVIMDQIADVIRSNNFIPADQHLSINIAAIRNIQGLNYPITNVWKDIVNKKSIMSIINEDELCLPRSIAVALARWEHIHSPHDEKLKKIYTVMRQKDRGRNKRSTTSLQKSTALKYQSKAGIPLYSIGTMESIPKYEKALEVGISVASARGGNKKVYQGNKNYKKQIVLYHIQTPDVPNGHFAVITTMTGFLSRSYYCEDCDRGFSNNDKHSCRNWCSLCGHNSCPISYQKVECPRCHAPCRSMQCLSRHQKSTKKYPSKCERMMFCPDCKVRLKRVGEQGRSLDLHLCGEAYCSNCHFYYINEDHKCYMRSSSSGNGKLKRFIFYDIESLLDDNGDQIPNLIIAHSICDRCGDETSVTPKSRCSYCGSRCDLCNAWGLDTFRRPPCHGCGYREMIFRGANTMSDFGRWLFSPQHRNVYALAHNARAYDGYFLYNYIINNSMVPDIIFRGTKIMSLKVGSGLNITLLDSLNFLSMPLADLPKSFGLNEMKKGYFPHLYHIPKHMGDPKFLHLPSHPDVSFYDIDSMKKSKRAQFLKWYNEHSHLPFHFWKEIIEYCRSDVNILLNACWKFRCLVMESTGPENPVDPFDYVTIASVCMGIFRTKYLREEWKVLKEEDEDPHCLHEWDCTCPWTRAIKKTAHSPLQWEDGTEVCDTVRQRFVSSPIALLPPHGYARRDNYSKVAMQWLKHMENEFQKQGQSIHIQTAQYSSGEKIVPHRLPSGKLMKYKLDGYFRDSEGNEHALEFYGCWYHGCPACYPKDRDTIQVSGKSLEQRYSSTKRKEKILRGMGFVVHTMWGCEFQRSLKQNNDLSQWIEQLEIPDPISVRDAYFGGRTNAIQLHKTMKGQEKAGYLDFCSLYPYVLKYRTYPVGHPTRITQNYKSLERQECKDASCAYVPCPGYHMKFPYFGLVKARVLPPRGLLFPVLPIRCNQKLMFPLCAHCASHESQVPCVCRDELRVLHHTWCTPELETALNMGYTLLGVDEVLHWERTACIDPLTGKGGLFTDYINTFLKLKAEASGYPEGIRSWDEQQAYIKKFQQHEGIELDPTLIEFNPGLRSLAKLALNSFYGKFGQRTNMKKSVFIREPHLVYKLLSDYTKKICDMHVMNEDMAIVEYTDIDEFKPQDRKTNVMISALCTTYARLKLWEVLNRTGNRVLYHDTDSVIYTYTPESIHPPTGSFLGELTNELSCKDVGCSGCEQGHWIVEFVGCGAKNYAYKLNTGQVVCKVRGFSLNYSASQVVNMNSMRQVLHEWHNQKESPPMTTYKTMISRDKYSTRVYAHQMAKSYGVVYNKRVVSQDYSTLPYGY